MITMIIIMKETPQSGDTEGNLDLQWVANTGCIYRRLRTLTGSTESCAYYVDLQIVEKKKWIYRGSRIISGSTEG